MYWLEGCIGSVYWWYVVGKYPGEVCVGQKHYKNLQNPLCPPVQGATENEDVNKDGSTQETKLKGQWNVKASGGRFLDQRAQCSLRFHSKNET